MTISFINQKNEEITNIDWTIDSNNIYEKYMAAELLRKNNYELKY